MTSFAPAVLMHLLRTVRHSETRKWLVPATFAISDQALTSGATLVLNLILIHGLSRHGYGTFAVVNAAFLLTSGIHNSLILEPMSVLAPGLDKSGYRSYFGAILVSHFAICACIVLLFMLAEQVIPPSVLMESAFVAVLAMPFVLLSWLIRRVCYVFRSPKAACVGSLLNFTILIAIAGIAETTGMMTAQAPWVITAIASLAAAFAMWRMIPPLHPLTVGRESAVALPSVLCEHWHIGRWVALQTIFTAGTTFLPIVFAALTMNIAAAGTIRGLELAVQPISQTMVAIGSMLVLPSLASDYARHEWARANSKAKTLSRVFLLLAMVYLALLVIFRTQVDYFVGGEGASASSWLVPLYGLAPVAVAAGSGQAIALRAAKQVRYYPLSTGLPGLVALISTPALTLWWGITGTVVGVVLSAAVLTSLTLILFQSWLVPSDRVPDRNERRTTARTAPDLAVKTPCTLLQGSGRSAGRNPSLLIALASRGSVTKPPLSFEEFKRACLYWFPTWIDLAKRGIDLSIALQQTTRQDEALPFSVVPVAGWTLKLGARRELSLTSPSLIWKIMRSRATTVMAVEYSTATIWAMIATRLSGRQFWVYQEAAPPRSRPKAILARFLARRADRLVANSMAAVVDLQCALGVDATRITKSPMISPPDTHHMLEAPVQTPLSSNCVVFLAVSQLIHRKNLSTLLKASQVVKARGERFKVWIVGSGPLHEQLVGETDELGLSETVEFIGQIPYESIGYYYRAADAFVLSSHYDYRSVSVLEAMRFGLPLIVSTMDGNVPELAIPDDNALVFHPTDVAALAGHLTTMIRCKDTRLRMGRRSELVIDDQTAEMAGNILLDLLQADLSNRRLTSTRRLRAFGRGRA